MELEELVESSLTFEFAFFVLSDNVVHDVAGRHVRVTDLEVRVYQIYRET